MRRLRPRMSAGKVVISAIGAALASIEGADIEKYSVVKRYVAARQSGSDT